MKTPTALSNLLQKPMDRQEFLRHTAAIVLFVSGGSVLVQSVLKGIGQDQALTALQSPGTVGYGASAYGGSQLSKD